MSEAVFNNELDNFIRSIKEAVDIPPEDINEDMLEALKKGVNENFTIAVREQIITELINNMDAQRLSRYEAKKSISEVIKLIKEIVYDEKYTPLQIKMVDALMEPVIKIFNDAVDRFHLFNIELPLTLAEGAQVPSYAHDTDACADLYALEDTVVPPQTYGNKLRTGVNIQLPEGWLAMIFPRSSTGAKTSLRLSNSVGIIDSGYRGELGVLFDNTSTGAIEIKKGDRIAQLLVMPSYRFQPKVVESLEDSDRGEGGFGSTGT